MTTGITPTTTYRIIQFVVVYGALFQIPSHVSDVKLHKLLVSVVKIRERATKVAVIIENTNTFNV